MLKGLEYERYINEHLNESEHIKISYLWKNVPEYVLFDYGFITDYNQHRKNIKNNENPLQDIGTDILYINQEDECVIVQCKNYTNSIKIEDLAGFYYIMNLHRNKKGEVYYTSSLSRLIHESENIKYFKKEIVNNNEEIVIIKPYDYQQKVINIAIEYYKNNDSGIISLPCGTGKTLIGCYIAMNYNVVIIVTPLKQYAKQNIDKFLEYEKNRKCLLIDSDGTRNINEINNFIKSNKKILLSCTYKSCDIIVVLIDNLENVIIIFDEFHNFSYNNIYSEEDCINILINNSKCKKLYLSATPRIYELEGGNDDIDVNDIFGNYIYQMSFNEAIDKKYISDYELYLPIFDTEDNIEEIKNLNIHEDYLQKVLFLIEGIKKFGYLKVVVYFRDHKEITDFIESFNKIKEYYAYEVEISSIKCNNSNKKRDKILNEFNNSNKISILLSVHILDEAIDIRTCNAVYMTYVCNSKIKNIQRMSRALRYQKNKVAKVLLFCKDIDESLNYLSSIKEYDIDFVKKIKYTCVSNEIKNKKIRDKKEIEKIEESKIRIIGIKLYNKNKNWLKKLELIKTYIDKYKKRPSAINKNRDIKILGKWLSYQQSLFNKKQNIMNDEEIYNIWNEFINIDYKEYFLNNKVIWKMMLNRIEEYIHKYKKRPSSIHKNEEIKKLGCWISDQQKKYIKKIEIMKNEEIYNLWGNFININYKEYFLDNKVLWKITLNNLIEYIINNNKKPSISNKNEQVKILAFWLSRQQTNFIRKKLIMKDEEIYNLWDKFINIDYKEYFLDNKVLWNLTLDKLKKYINNNNKKPSECDKDEHIKKLGNWLSSQQQNYIKKKNIMKDEEIYRLWDEFINNDIYKKFFLDKKTSWNLIFNEVKEYINNNNKIPSQRDKDEHIKKLGNWVTCQQQNYIKKKNIMEDEEIYKLWSEFIHIYKK